MPVASLLSMLRMRRPGPVAVGSKVVVLPKFRLGWALKICSPLMNSTVSATTHTQCVTRTQALWRRTTTRPARASAGSFPVGAATLRCGAVFPSTIVILVLTLRARVSFHVMAGTLLDHAASSPPLQSAGGPSQDRN